MKTRFGFFFALLFVALSCDSDIQYTGDLIVTSVGVTAVDGIPINQLKVGLFDINVLITNHFYLNEAISTEIFNQGVVEFKGLNPGNYVVALTSSSGFRKTVQVTVGKTVTVDLFN